MTSLTQPMQGGVSRLTRGPARYFLPSATHGASTLLPVGASNAADSTIFAKEDKEKP